MKKLMAFVFALALVLGLAACSAQKTQEEEIKYDLIPMVMVDGKLYLDTGHSNNNIHKCGTFDGEITSMVDGSEKPAADNQSNFGTGYGYQYGATKGTVEIYMNDKWRIFATEEVRQQIQFPKNNAVSQETATLKEPPALTVVYGENNSIEALRGTSSWMYANEDGTWTGIEADSMHPLNAKEYMPYLELLPIITSSRSHLKVRMQWDTIPDKVTIRCWSDEYWGQYDAESEEISVKVLCIDSSDGGAPCFSGELKDGNYVYEVIAEWSSAETYHGNACYSFYTVKSDMK